MNNYILIKDPIRTKNFAIVTEVDGQVTFYPMNKMASLWADEKKGISTLSGISAPDGMYVSSPKKITASLEVLLESIEMKENHEEEALKEIVSTSIYSGRTKLSISSSNKKILGKQIRKMPKSSKVNVVSYKAMAFLGRARKSSVISTVKIRKLKVDKNRASFSDPKSNGIVPLEKSAGINLSRRIASSVFINDSFKSNRLSRRAGSLSSASEELTQKKSISDAINFSIDSKSKRFL